MKREVLLPQPIEDAAVQILKESGFRILQAAGLEPETLLPLLHTADAVILRTGLDMTADLIGEAPGLATISRTGAGVDNVDLISATERGVLVTSSIGVNTDSVVEHCLALLLALSKRLLLLDRETRAGNFAIRYKNLPRDLQGKWLGIVGFGRIGSLLAEKCHRLFNMRIIAHDPLLSQSRRGEYADWVDFATLEEVCRHADILSIHVPATSDTRSIIGWKQFSCMKPHALVINASRGGVVNESDLVRALEEGLIGGAGLDVFEHEPLENSNPLVQFDNVLLTPHAAALTGECVVRMAVSAAQRVIDIFDGHVPDNIANPEVLEHERWRHLKRRP